MITYENDDGFMNSTTFTIKNKKNNFKSYLNKDLNSIFIYRRIDYVYIFLNIVPLKLKYGLNFSK